jgi:RHS repeat-associated protein
MSVALAGRPDPPRTSPLHAALAELGPVVMADDPCEAAFSGATPTGPRKYYRARYYDPKVGRFLSEDPAALNADGPNYYTYVSNNPTVATDPTGEVAVVLVPPAVKVIAWGTAAAVTAATAWWMTQHPPTWPTVPVDPPFMPPMPGPSAQPPSPSPSPGPVPIPGGPTSGPSPSPSCSPHPCQSAWNQCIQQWKNMPGRTPTGNPMFDRTLQQMYRDHMKRCMQTKTGCENWEPPQK